MCIIDFTNLIRNFKHFSWGLVLFLLQCTLKLTAKEKNDKCCAPAFKENRFKSGIALRCKETTTHACIQAVKKKKSKSDFLKV